MHNDFHSADVHGGGDRCDPHRVSKLMVVVLSEKKPADCPRRVLTIGGAFFGPWSIFDPVMKGQRSNFRKIDIFST